MDWVAVNRVADDVLITAGLLVLVARQFCWRSAALTRMLRLPLIVIGVGLGYLVVELWRGFGWMPADAVLLGELVLVAITGTAMGWVTRFRRQGERLQYKLTGAGLALWALFVGVRAGSYWLAARLGAHLAGATGLILLSFGINRLAAILVVRRRARALLVR